MTTLTSHHDLPLTRIRLIQAGMEMRDWNSFRDWLVSLVAASLVFGVVLVAGAIVGG